jgi:hypothetical protein
MLETGTSGLMSGDEKRDDASRRHPRLSSTLQCHPLEETEPRVILSAEREESLRSSRVHTAWGFFTSFRMTGRLRFGPPHQHLPRETIYEMGSSEFTSKSGAFS